MPVNSVFVSVDGLEAFTTAVFARLGLPPEDAAEVATCLLTAEIRGIGSHGVTRVPIYAERLRRGLVTATPSIGVKRTSSSVAIVDGDDGMGAVVGSRAMREAVALASEHGAAAVAVRRSNHYGIASYYAMQALEHDCIGLALTNAAPTMAPWGGREPFLGTNPVAAAVPAGAYPAIVLDMATSVVARGKIILAAQRGEPIPEGWALDAEGEPTTDADKALAGAVLPFAGPKGSGLALLVDMLSGVLAGAAIGRQVGNLYTDFEARQNVGHFFVVLHVAKFMAVDEFKARMDAMIGALKACAPAVGGERVLMPGEIELATAAERRRTGIPLSREIVEALRKVADDLNLAHFESSPKPLAAESVNG